MTDPIDRRAGGGHRAGDPARSPATGGGHDRWRSRIAIAAVLVIAVPVMARLAAVEDGTGADTAVEQGTPTPGATPGGEGASDAAPPPDPPGPAVTPAQAQLEATVHVTLMGPLADALDIQVRGVDAVTRTAIGHPLTAWTELLIRARTPEPVQLPAVPVRADGASWTAVGDGLSVAVGPPPPVQVLAGGPPGTSGTEVAADIAPPWLPRMLWLQVHSTDLLTSDATREVEVPFGDSTIRVSVTFTASTSSPTPHPPQPAEAAVGTVLDVPDRGGAAVVLLADGTPVWIAHTDHHGVTVVDGRSPFRPNGITQLVRWCPSAEGFDEAFGGSRFTADGTYAFGPAPTGLTTYAVEPAGEGRVRVTAGAPGDPRPPPVDWPPLTGVEGYPVDPGPVFAGPSCDAEPEGVPDVDPASLRSTSPPLGGYPHMDIPALGSAAAEGWTGRTVVDARVMADEGGRGLLCVPVAERPGCTDGVPVDLGGLRSDDADPTRPAEPAEPAQPAEPAEPAGAGTLVAYDARMVVSLEAGVVVEAWMDGYVPGLEVDAAGNTIPAVRYVITRVIGTRTGDDAVGYDCSPVPGARPCPAVIDAEELAVINAGDPLAPLGRVPVWEPLPAHAEAALVDGRVPEGWVVTDEHFADGDAHTTLVLADADVLADGTPVADIPLGRLVVVVERNGHVSAVLPLAAPDDALPR